jgi:hypothetical protein
LLLAAIVLLFLAKTKKVFIYVDMGRKTKKHLEFDLVEGGLRVHGVVVDIAEGGHEDEVHLRDHGQELLTQYPSDLRENIRNRKADDELISSERERERENQFKEDGLVCILLKTNLWVFRVYERTDLHFALTLRRTLKFSAECTTHAMYSYLRCREKESSRTSTSTSGSCSRTTLKSAERGS